MTSKQERRRNRKQKQLAASGRLRRRSDRSSVEMALASAGELVARYVRSAGGPDEAAAAVRADLQAAAAEIVVQACGLNLIRVVSSVHVSMIMNRSVAGAELSAAALELVSLVLACRDSTITETSVPVDTSGFMPPEIETAAREALSSGQLIGLFESPPTDAESELIYRSVQREILLRNPVYPEMLLETLRGLFDDAAVSADCQAVLGFTGLEAVNVMAAIRTLSIAQLESRFRRMEAARDASVPHLEAMNVKGRDDWSATTEQIVIMREVFDAMEALTTNIADATAVDIGAVADVTGYERSTVEAVVDTFTLVGPTDITDALERFFRGDNPLRTAPIVANTQGDRMLVHDGLALPAVREVIEVELQAANRWNAYRERRGTWVENAAVDLLASVFPGATIFRGFNYFIPDPKAVTPQTDPVGFTKRVEGDGLILIDDVALIIEVKAVALTAEARCGVASRLRGKLRDIVTAAAEQAGRLRERILADGRIRLEDGQWIDVSGIREIHTIAVGLEDLSGVTTATATLLAAGVIKPDNIPWTVSVHDLRLVCELVDRPSELLLYLRRRTHPQATWRYRAVDELDLFLVFLTRGLYVEADPHKIAKDLPWTGPPSPDDVRRFTSQQPVLIDSHTEPLDSWYQAQRNPVGEAVPKPCIVADRNLLELVDKLIETSAPGWLSITASLLEGNSAVQRTFGRYATDLAKHVRRDRKHHSITHLMGDTDGRHVLLVWVCHAPDETVDAAASYLGEYLQAKKHQTHAYRAACMIFDPAGRRLVRLLYDNDPVGFDPVLDSAAAYLVPLEEMTKATPRPIRPPRPRH